MNLNSYIFESLLDHTSKKGIQDLSKNIENREIAKRICNGCIVNPRNIHTEYYNYIYGLEILSYQTLMGFKSNSNIDVTPSDYNHKKYFDLNVTGKTLIINYKNDYMKDNFEVMGVRCALSDIDNYFSNGYIDSLKTNGAISSEFLHSYNPTKVSVQILPINNLKNIECSYFLNICDTRNLVSSTYLHFSFEEKNIKVNKGLHLTRYNGLLSTKNSPIYTNKIKGGIVFCMGGFTRHLFKNTKIYFDNKDGAILFRIPYWKSYVNYADDVTLYELNHICNFKELETNASILVFESKFLRYLDKINKLLDNNTITDQQLKNIIKDLPPSITKIYFICSIYLKNQSSDTFIPVFLKKKNNIWIYSTFKTF